MGVCCQQDDRRDAVRRMHGLNGLDYVEVSDDQVTLTAYFLGKLPPEFHKREAQRHVAIEGGERVIGIKVTGVTPVTNPAADLDDALVVRVDRAGDFSSYTLRLVGVEQVDPRYESVAFSFKIDCPSDLDCTPACACEPAVFDQPEINYLAKDYASFRQLILDRLAVLVPDWNETHAADLGIALVELLAYTADYLSYYQDAVATEAYIGTARQRISVRRLARLVDYFLHQGCNARTWVCVETETFFEIPAGSSFITGLNNALAVQQTILTWDSLQGVPTVDYEVFEPLTLDGAAGHDAGMPIYPAHSEIQFYTWGEKECCLEKGSTSATLLDGWDDAPARRLRLQPGDVLIFEEVVGPHTGLGPDANPKRRQAVRITRVTPGEDKLFLDAAGRGTPYLGIEWAREDALRFPFCISTVGPAPDCVYLSDVSVARGNVIAVDHGRTLPPEDLGTVPSLSSQASCECAGEPTEVQMVPGRVRPTLARTPLTYRETPAADHRHQDRWTAAASLLTQDVRQALPQVWLTSNPAESWSVHYDLVESQASDWHFVVEIDDEGTAHLRFGDGTLGAQPPAGMTLGATYRVGNGSSGNVGAEAISRLVSPTLIDGARIVVRNPLPAQGGTDAEPIAEAKLYAPHVFRKQIERAITAGDYRTIAQRNPKIQRAAASLNWTGSWYEADVAVDPLGTERAAPGLLHEIDRYLEPFRKMGQDLAVVPARYIPIDLEMQVCALPKYERAHVKAALLDAFGTRTLPGGKRGFFHPDNLSFGEGLYLSQIVAAVLAVTGVECITITKFQRLFAPANGEIDNGVLPLATYEIAQLDNNPDFPERGRLVIDVQGGR